MSKGHGLETQTFETLHFSGDITSQDYLSLQEIIRAFEETGRWQTLQYVAKFLNIHQ